jgi:hypothetical protein
MQYPAGQARIIAHVAAHELGAAAYATKAVRVAVSEGERNAAGRLECLRQCAECSDGALIDRIGHAAGLDPARASGRGAVLRDPVRRRTDVTADYVDELLRIWLSWQRGLSRVRACAGRAVVGDSR